MKFPLSLKILIVCGYGRGSEQLFSPDCDPVCVDQPKFEDLTALLRSQLS